MTTQVVLKGASRGLSPIRHHFFVEDKIILRPRPVPHVIYSYLKDHVSDKTKLATKEVFSAQYKRIFKDFDFMAVDRDDENKIAKLQRLAAPYLTEPEHLALFSRKPKRNGRFRFITFYDNLRDYYVKNGLLISPVITRILRLSQHDLLNLHLLTTDHIKAYGYKFPYQFWNGLHEVLANNYQRRSFVDSKNMNPVTSYQALGALSISAQESFSRVLVTTAQASNVNRQKISEFLRKTFGIPGSLYSTSVPEDQKPVFKPLENEVVYMVFNDPNLLPLISNTLTLLSNVLPHAKTVFVRLLDDGDADQPVMINNIPALHASDEAWDATSKATVSSAVSQLQHIRLDNLNDLSRLIEVVANR